MSEGTRAAAAEYFRLSAEELRADQKRAGEIEKSLMEKLERWEGMEGKAGAAAT